MATFNGTAANETFVGGSDDDVADGAGGNDTLRGNGGSDQLIGGAGADTLEGGLGDDFLASYAADTNFFAYPYSNSLALDVFADADLLNAGDGDDHLSAGYGDTVIGGAGRDALIISFRGASAGVIVDFTQLYSIGSVSVGGATISGIEGVPWVEGSEFDDEIIGHNGDYMDFTRMFGRGGNDRLIADYKCSLLDGGTGNDYLDGRFSYYLTDVIGGSGNDTIILRGDQGTRIDAGAGADTITAGYSEVHGGTGNDTITAQDSAYGEAQVFGDDGNDRLFGGEGWSYLFGGAGGDLLRGNGGNDFMRSADGDFGTDTNIDNGLEIDQLYGGDGDDDIGIGYGDSADGGNGTDRLALSFAASAVGASFDTAGVLAAAPLLLAGGTIQGFESVGRITGTALNDVFRIRTQSIEARVDGGAGNDTVFGYGAPVIFNGEAGNDTYINGIGADTIDGGAGTDNVSYAQSLLGVTITMGATAADWGSGPAGDVLRDIENVTGSAHDDQIIGNSANNSFKGGGGDDVLDGGSGNDILNGGVGIDTASYASSTAGVSVSLAISTSQNTLGAGRDTLIGIEKLAGSAFGDWLRGRSVADDLFGDAGDDILQGGLGDDLLRGGDGIDMSDYADATNAVTIDMRIAGAQNTGWGVDTFVAMEGAVGSAFADTLTGSGGANKFSGGAGNDTIAGLGGDDWVEGGDGNDTLLGAAGIDTLAYETASAGVTVHIGVSTAQNTLGAGTDTVSGFENLLGSAFADRLTGNNLANRIDGGEGDDIVRGLLGNDTLLGGTGNDEVWSGLGNDVLDGGDGFDTLNLGSATSGVTINLSVAGAQATGGVGMDTISGFEVVTGSVYNDALTGAGANETLNGEAGNDLLDGGLGDDVLNGGDGSDTASYASSNFVFISVDLAITGAQNTGAGADTLTGIENLMGSAWFDVLKGDAAANRIDGLDGTDVIYGRSGNDTLIGGTGDDELHGGAGNDTLVGGAGWDKFYLEDAFTAGNADTIDDFTVGQDQIYIARHLLPGLMTPFPLLPENFRVGTAALDFDDRIIYNSATGALLYDADGFGVKAAVQIATLDAGLALTNNDIFVF